MKNSGKCVYIFLLVVSITLILNGCQTTSSKKEKEASKTKIEEIYEENQEYLQSEESKKLKETVSQRILDNMKKNSANTFDNLQRTSEQVTAYKPDDKPKGFEEIADEAALKINRFAWGSVIGLLIVLQGSSVPIAFIMLLLFGSMAGFFRKDKPKYRFFLFCAIGGPIIFLLVNYLPAFLWYLNKN